jgi:hypothetical protein
MRAVHAEAKKRGMDHDALHDLALNHWGARSLADASDTQLYALYRDWTRKGLKRRAAPFAPGQHDDERQFVSGEDLIEMAEEFAQRGWGETTRSNFIRRQLKGRSKISTRADLRKVLFAVRAMNRRDAQAQEKQP